MKVIALLPVRNEAWVLPHSLECLSAFCDVILVNDQDSEDGSREICRQFPKVVLIASDERLICEQARWQLLDAARDYDGCNLLWCTDADELMSAPAATRFLEDHRDQVTPGTLVECRYVHLWNGIDRYHGEAGPYRPYWKELGLVDDRRMDFSRSRGLPLHEPRVPLVGAAGTLRASALTILHLQWLLAERNQVKQAWYRCREWLDGSKTAAAINQFYSITLPDPRVRTEQVPTEWAQGITFPDLAIDAVPTWQGRDINAWFDEHSPEFFEPLEIWHIAALAAVFRARVGRSPQPDRSYLPSWPSRAQSLGRRLVRAARRRLPA